MHWYGVTMWNGYLKVQVGVWEKAGRRSCCSPPWSWCATHMLRNWGFLVWTQRCEGAFVTLPFLLTLFSCARQSLGALACKMWLEQLAFKATFWSGTINQWHETKSHVSFIWFAVKCPCVTLFSHSFLCCRLNLNNQYKEWVILLYLIPPSFGGLKTGSNLMSWLFAWSLCDWNAVNWLLICYMGRW